MSEQLDLNLKTARAARDAGVSFSAAKNAGWIDTMLGHLRHWRSPGTEFQMELFREWVWLNGLPKPTDHHAWGALTRAAVLSRLIVWTGRYDQAASRKTHAHPVKVWRKL